MTKTNSQFLQNIYHMCRDIGVVRSQYEFSTLCGRETSWMSCSKSRDRAISTEAAYTLAHRLKHMVDNKQINEPFLPSAHALIALLFSMMNDRAVRKHNENC